MLLGCQIGNVHPGINDTGTNEKLQISSHYIRNNRLGYPTIQSVPVCSEFGRILILIVLESQRAAIWQPHGLLSLLTYHIHKALMSISNQGGVGLTWDIPQS